MIHHGDTKKEGIMNRMWQNYKIIFFIFFAASLTFGSGTADAWNARGCVYCDTNQDKEIDSSDILLQGVRVNIDENTNENTGETFAGSDLTEGNGCFWIGLPDSPASFIETLDGATLPVDASYIIPESGEFLFSTTETEWYIYRDWLIDSATCREVGCRVTGGGNDTAGISPDGGWDGSLAEDRARSNNNSSLDYYTFGGQAGANTGLPPQPKGEWTHHQKRGPDGSFVFHAGTASAPAGTEIAAIVCSDEGYCAPARPAPNKQIDFAGVGTFKNQNALPVNSSPLATANLIPGETYHWFEVHIEDLGEPGNEPRGGNKKNVICTDGGSGTDAFADPPVFLPANCGCADFYRIRIYNGVIPVFDPITGEITNLNKTTVVYEVFGYINGGNLQIHPLTGFDLK